MGKSKSNRGGKSQKNGDKNTKRSKNNVLEDGMDDEIDAFHKQRDLVPLNVNEASEDSDDDEEVPVFDFEDEDDDKDESEEDEDDIRDTGFAAKIARQQKYMKEKFGGVGDAMDDEEEEEEEEERNVPWSGSKHQYYDADNADYELQSSGDESPAEEEAEVIRLQNERAKSMSMADFGAEDTSEDDSDRELTLKEISVKGKGTKKSSLKKDEANDVGTSYEEVKKDLNALSREEQMDVLFSSAPELVGLLSELNHAVEELESKVDPLLNKVQNGEIKLEGGIRYLELKKLLLLSYSQAITFYLLLKSEGHPVRDHPVLARLIEIKSLLDKTKELDGNIPTKLEEILDRSSVLHSGKAIVTSIPDSSIKDHEPYHVSHEIQATAVVPTNNDTNVGKVELLKENGNKAEKRKRQDDQVGIESMKMLKARAVLEEKLKQKGVFGSIMPKVDKTQKLGKPLYRRLETYDDFNDDTSNANVTTCGLNNGHKSSLGSSRLSRLIVANPNKSKAVSGDDDLPPRDDIGERRRKHELQVLARAGIVPDDEADGDAEMDDEDDDMGEDEDTGSEDEFYKQVKQQKAAKIAAKAEIYSRNTAVPSLPETVDGKRLITYQMEKNRGLTRQRKKLIKNPRKKYKLKHQKAVKRREGQVREVKKPVAPYGGEATGINSGISRSIRFKN